MPRISGQADTDGQLKQLGEAIRARRKLSELTQEALADAAGIDRSHMGKIERGERNVTLLNIVRIAKALDTLPSTLFSAAGM